MVELDYSEDVPKLKEPNFVNREYFSNEIKKIWEYIERHYNRNQADIANLQKEIQNIKDEYITDSGFATNEYLETCVRDLENRIEELEN